MSDPRHAIVEKEGHLLTVTLNRPEARNAFSPEMLVGMYDAWRQLDADDELRVAILTGAGGHFCAGADLKTMHGEQTPPDLKKRFDEVPELHWQALLRHKRPQKPIIAAVEGYAVAGGTEILQATEIRVASESARFGVAEVRWSLFPVGGSTVRLRRQIPSRAPRRFCSQASSSPQRRRSRSASSGASFPRGRRWLRHGRSPT